MTKQFLVFQSDFSNRDGAVSAMHGVALSVCPTLSIHEITHNITPFHIWEASYRLVQTVPFWPEGTVFVSVVDPGVGSNRRSVVAQTETNHYIVTPDNGTLTHVAQEIGLKKLFVIDEANNRLPTSAQLHTFHGRDIFAYTGARLAAGLIEPSDVGEEVAAYSTVHLAVAPPKVGETTIDGCIDIIDTPFGNIWTNIEAPTFGHLATHYNEHFAVTIAHEGNVVFKQSLPFIRSFAYSESDEPFLYVNSLRRLAIGLNQHSFADAYHVSFGPNWTVTIEKAKKVRAVL